MRNGCPIEGLAMHILGKLLVTHFNNNKHIIVLSDYFIKLTKALTMPNMIACTVALILIEEVL